MQDGEIYNKLIPKFARYKADYYIQAYHMDAFICHADEDNNQALSVYDLLKKNGFSCWIDDRDIPGGARFRRDITRAIINCKAMIFVYSSNCNNSDDIPNEIQIARDTQKPIIVFRLDRSQYKDDLYYQLAGIQYIKAYQGNFEYHIPELIDSLKSHLSSTEHLFSTESLSIIVGRVSAYANGEVGIGGGWITILEKDRNIKPSDPSVIDVDGWSIAMYTRADAYGWYVMPIKPSLSKIYKLYAKWGDSAQQKEPMLNHPWSLTYKLYSYQDLSAALGEEFTESFVLDEKKCLIKHIRLKLNPSVFGKS